MIPGLHWPFEAIRDHEGRASNWVMLHGPIVTPAQHSQFADLRRYGARFAGMTSYFDFPRADSRDGLDYESICEAWCHCFRQPQRHFLQDAPRALLSASDFSDWAWVARNAACAPPPEPYELVYVGAAEPWQQQAKNWPLAARCLPQLCRAFGMRALVIGQADSTFPPQPGIRFQPSLEWPALLAALARAQLLFVPNAIDPSPRVVAEALCLDLPVLMQRHILGGWKYINRYTGIFFDDENDVVHAASELLASVMAPREWFCGNFGPETSSRRLSALLQICDSALDKDAGWRVSAAGPQRHQAA